MDDGSIQNKGLHLNVYGFTLNEVVNLKNTLENLFIPTFAFAPKEAKVNRGGAIIKCSIHNHKKGYRIYI
jgi:hypothetical protein